MTDLIDAARRLADVLPECPCWYELPGENAHKPECHVPVLPQIVRALEAAQAVVDAAEAWTFSIRWRKYVIGEEPISALRNALDGEPSQNAEAGTSI